MYLLYFQANRVGRVDVFVQSCDKNLMVPVGGSVIASTRKSVTEKIAQTYAGRASAGPSMDVFITLLEMGMTGYERLLKDRKVLARYLLMLVIISHLLEGLSLFLFGQLQMFR